MSDAGWTALASVLVGAIVAVSEVIKEWIRARYGVDTLRSPAATSAASPGRAANGSGGPIHPDLPPAK